MRRHVPPPTPNTPHTRRCNINETLIKEVADALVASGLRDAGYQYVNIDDCWMAKRDAAGVLQPNATKFPSGMKALGDYIHARGLKFGIYSDAGNTTCEGYPASWGHEQQVGVAAGGCWVRTSVRCMTQLLTIATALSAKCHRHPCLAT
jgi:alpha-galactosidase